MRSNPVGFLADRNVFIDNPLGDGEKIMLESEFHEGFGLTAVLPPEAPENTSVFVEDPDCSNEFLFVNPLLVANEDFFIASDLFVVPPIPVIIIPNQTVTINIDITNAWITPYERSYCIWFVPELDTDGNELKALRPYLPGKDEESVAMGDFDKLGSHEFLVCDENTRLSNINADKNPVTGFVDKNAPGGGVVRIRIDRSAKGLGFENFSGFFIDPEGQLPDESWKLGGGCVEGGSTRETFMLLTSESTGQQILMIQAG